MRAQALVTSWRAYRAWARACLLNAWRATRSHFGAAWPGALKVIGPGVVTTFALCLRGDNLDPQTDIPVAIAAGCAASLLWVVAVFCWNFALAPYRLWLAARARIVQLQAAIGRRIDRQVIAQELELRIREGVADRLECAASDVRPGRLSQSRHLSRSCPGANDAAHPASRAGCRRLLPRRAGRARRCGHARPEDR